VVDRRSLKCAKCCLTSVKNVQRNKQKQLEKNSFFVGALKVSGENSRIREPDPNPLVRGADSDPYQNVTDPRHFPFIH
jgi:hypothetical protein